MDYIFDKHFTANYLHYGWCECPETAVNCLPVYELFFSVVDIFLPFVIIEPFPGFVLVLKISEGRS